VTASRRLIAKLELAHGSLNEAVDPLWFGPDGAALYPE